MADIAGLLRTERERLVELLETLSPGEWATPSLCDGWSVRDVAAHLAWTPAQRPLAIITNVVKHGFRVNQLNVDDVARWSRHSTDEILTQLRANAESGARPFGMPKPAPLCDAVVHGLDIRRPLDRPASIPPDAFGVVADFLAGLRWPGSVLVGGSARKRIRGVRLVVDDLAWSHGQGPDVHGSAEAVLLLLSGRSVEPGELRGAGAVQIYARLPAP